jgi:hypothetical protein
MPTIAITAAIRFNAVPGIAVDMSFSSRLAA